MSYSDYKKYINKRIKNLDCCCPNDSGSSTLGPRGAPGPTGDIGPTGADGISYTGPTGPKGEGYTGPTGDSSTIIGPTGASFTVAPDGPTGDKGQTGDIGPPGDTGPQGDIGPTGLPTGPIDLSLNLVFGANFFSANGVPPAGTGFLSPFFSGQGSTGYWLVPFSDMIDTNKPTANNGNISAVEGLGCNYSSGPGHTTTGAPTQSTRPPPAMTIPFDTIEISAISVHLTSTSGAGTGWGTPGQFLRVELSAFLFCDISLNGFPWDTAANDFVKYIDLGIYTNASCFCKKLVEPFQVGCKVANGTRGAIAIAFKWAGSPSVLINQPSISVALHYKIVS